MNKKVLMLAPFMGLFLASCGNQSANWKEITYEKAITLRDTMQYYFSAGTKTMKANYVGNKAIIGDAEMKNLGPAFAFDYDKKFESILSYEQFTQSKSQVYYVEKDDKLWRLESTNDIKTKHSYDDYESRIAFDSFAILSAKSAMMGIFYGDPSGYGKLEMYVSILNSLQAGVKDGTFEYKFYSYNKDSLKFVISIKDVTFEPITPSNDDVKFNGTEEYVLENGRMSYIKSTGNGVGDVIAAVQYGIEPTKTEYEVRYLYNCSVSIPKEANPDTWCE